MKRRLIKTVSAVAAEWLTGNYAALTGWHLQENVVSVWGNTIIL